MVEIQKEGLSTVNTHVVEHFLTYLPVLKPLELMKEEGNGKYFVLSYEGEGALLRAQSQGYESTLIWLCEIMFN